MQKSNDSDRQRFASVWDAIEDKPSATAEKHYTVRPLELLRLHHEKIEAWILEQAGIVFDAKAAPGALRVVGKV